jgi:hypothetical protein
MRFRQSHAKVLLSHCPAVLRRMIDGGHYPSKAMEAGSLVDYVLFRRSDRYELVDARYKSGPREGQPAEDWTGTEAREQAQAIRARGLVPVLEHELDAAEEAAAPVRKRLEQLAEGGMLLEQPHIEWTSSLGIECEGTPDAVIVRPHGIHVVDIKRTDPRPDKIARQVHAMGWDIQAAAYREASTSEYSQLYLGHIILTVDPDGMVPPCARPLEDIYIEIGQRRWEKAQLMWKECLDSGEWPGYPESPIAPPYYTVRKELEHTTFGGEIEVEP